MSPRTEMIFVISGLSSLINGIFLSLFRLYEPFFAFHFKKELKACYGIIHD